MRPQATDLFGEKVVLRAPAGTRVRGYADDPGTGPTGESCGSCTFIRRESNGSGNKRWAKCGHPLGYRSSCTASDIRAKAPACRHWEGA